MVNKIRVAMSVFLASSALMAGSASATVIFSDTFDGPNLDTTKWAVNGDVHVTNGIVDIQSGELRISATAGHDMGVRTTATFDQESSISFLFRKTGAATYGTELFMTNLTGRGIADYTWSLTWGGTTTVTLRTHQGGVAVAAPTMTLAFNTTYRFQIDNTDTTTTVTVYDENDTLVASTTGTHDAGMGAKNFYLTAISTGSPGGGGGLVETYMDNFQVVIPEPASMALLMSGGAMMLHRRRARAAA